jgi:hypothetical protein
MPKNVPQVDKKYYIQYFFDLKNFRVLVDYNLKKLDLKIGLFSVCAIYAPTQINHFTPLFDYTRI